MKRLFVEIWVREDETVTAGRIAPDVLMNLAASYTADVRTEDEIARVADGIGQRAYYQTVKDVVSNLVDEIKSGQLETEDEAREWLHQTIDGHHDVIYTACAKDILRYSNNEDALAEESGSEELVRDGQINWSGMAFAALMADVMEEIEDIGAYFTCTECHETVGNDCVRAADGFPTCPGCVDAEEEDSRSAESV
jgi:hypothetical protein